MAQDLFAPPTEEELRMAIASEEEEEQDLYAPPTEEELRQLPAEKSVQQDMFAPPTQEELAATENIAPPSPPESAPKYEPYDIQQGVDELVKAEGWRAKPYKDVYGNWTIGYGTLLTPEQASEMKDGISKEQGRELMMGKVNEKIGMLERYHPQWERLHPELKTQLLSATYRGSWSGSPKARQLFNRGMYEEAADEFLNNDEYRNAKKDNKLRGIAARMEKVAETIRTKGGKLQQEESPLLESVGRGLQRQFAPFSMKEEEAKESFDIPAIAANIGASVAAYAGLPAAGTAIAGPVGGIIGGAAAVGLGIYSALGEEYIQSKIENRDYDAKKAAVNVLVEANPIAILGKATKAGKALAMASQAGFQTEQARQYGAEKEGMMVAALLGIPGGLGQAGAARKAKAKLQGMEDVAKMKLASPKHVMGRAETEQIMDEMSTPGFREQINDQLRSIKSEHEEAKKLILPNMNKDMFKVVRDDAIAYRLNNEKEAFTRWLGDLLDVDLEEVGMEGLQEAIRTRGLQTDELFDTWREASLIKDEYIKTVKKKITNLTGESEEAYNGKGFTWRKLDDPSNIAADTDRISGVSKTLPLLYEVAEGVNRMEVDVAKYMTQLETLRKEMKKAGLSGSKFSAIMRNIDKKRLQLKGVDEAVREVEMEKVIPTQYKPLIDKFREFTDDFYQYQKKAGMFDDGQYIEHYMPHISVAPDVAVSRIRREAGRLIEYANQGKVEVGLALTSKKFEDFANLLEEMQRKLGVEIDVNDADDLRKFIGQIEKPQVYEKMRDVIEASNTFSRKYKINPLLLEDDPFRAYAMMINNGAKTKNLATTLAKFENEIDILEAAGMKGTAQYWRRYVGNMYGKKYGAKQTINDAIMRYKVWVRKNADEMQRELNFKEKTMLHGPEMLSWMMGSIYPNLLGFSNIYAPTRNLTQPHVMTAREFLKLANKNAKVFSKGADSAYIHGLASKAQAKSMLEATAKSPFKAIRGWKQILRDEGRMPGDYLGVGNSVLEESLRNVKGLGRIVEKVDDFNKLGMWLYESSDVANRWVTRNMSKEVIQRALEGEKRAIRMASAIPGEYGARIKEGIRRGNAKQAEDALIDYMLGKTQFHYGKHALSEFGRDFGQLAAMFTKWPSSVFGEMASDFKQKQYKNILMKYFTPVIALMAGDHAVDAIMGEDSKTRKALLGRSLVDASPVWAAGGIVNLPPVIDSAQAAIRLGKNAIAGDLDRINLQRDITKITAKYVPVWGAIETYKRRYGRED